MRKIFIDGGGHRATSVRYFRKFFEDADKFEIHSFEPLEENWSYFEQYKDDPMVILYKAGLWSETTEREFYIADHGSSSFFSDKCNVGGGEVRSVDCIGLEQWMLENLSGDPDKEYVILKLDVEGSEYEILKPLISSGTISYVDELYVEWHLKKVPSLSPVAHLDIVEKLVYDHGLTPYSWSAEEVDSVSEHKVKTTIGFDRINLYEATKADPKNYHRATALADHIGDRLKDRNDIWIKMILKG